MAKSDLPTGGMRGKAGTMRGVSFFGWREDDMAEAVVVASAVESVGSAAAVDDDGEADAAVNGAGAIPISSSARCFEVWAADGSAELSPSFLAAELGKRFKAWWTASTMSKKSEWKNKETL